MFPALKKRNRIKKIPLQIGLVLSRFGDITGVEDPDQDPIANKNPDPDTTVNINRFPALKNGTG